MFLGSPEKIKKIVKGKPELGSSRQAVSFERAVDLPSLVGRRDGGMAGRKRWVPGCLPPVLVLHPIF